MTTVLLTDKPFRRRRWRRTAPVLRRAGDGAPGLHVKLDKEGEPSNWYWWHADLSMGCGLCSDLVFVPVKGKAGREGNGVQPVAADLAVQEYEFKASFSAVILPGGAPAPAVEEQAEPEPPAPKRRRSKPAVPPAAAEYPSPLEDPAAVVKLFKDKIGKPFKAIELVLHPDLRSFRSRIPPGPRTSTSSFIAPARGRARAQAGMDGHLPEGFDLGTADFSLLPKLMKDASSDHGGRRACHARGPEPTCSARTSPGPSMWKAPGRRVRAL